MNEHSFICNIKEIGNNFNVHKQMNGYTNCSIPIQWNATQQKKKEKTTDTCNNMDEVQVNYVK